MFNRTSFIRDWQKTSLLALISLIASCDGGDRGGVAIQYPDSYLPPEAITENLDEYEFRAIVSFVGKCLQMDAQNYIRNTTPSPVNSWSCGNALAHQQWVLLPDETIRSPNGFCLTVGDTFQESGFEVYVDDCNGSEDQAWVFDEVGAKIYNLSYPSHCLDIWNANINENGRSIQLWECNGKDNQRWTYTELRSAYFRNVGQKDLYITQDISDQALGINAALLLQDEPEAQWLIEPVESSFRIRSAAADDVFIHIENDAAEASQIEPDWLSARWTFVNYGDPSDNLFQLKNLWKSNIYLGIDSQQKLVAAPLEELNESSSVWEVQQQFGF